MKRSASKAELSSEEEEPLDAVSDAVEPIQAGLGLEPQRFLGQRNVGEGSVQAASGAMLQSTRADLGFESCSFRDVERANSGDAVQPTQAGSRLESHTFEGQPNVEEGAIQPKCGAAVQPRQAGCFQEQPNVFEEVAIQANSGVAVQPITQQGLGHESHSFQEEPNVEEVAIQANSGVAVQPTQVGLGLESHSFQEEVAIQANSGVAVQQMQSGSRLVSHTFQEQPNTEEGAIPPNCGVAVQPMQSGLGLEPHSFQEQPNVETSGEVDVQPNLEMSSSEDLDSGVEVQPNLEMSSSEDLDSGVEVQPNSEMSSNEDLDSGVEVQPNSEMSSNEDLDSRVEVQPNSEMSSSEDLDSGVEVQPTLEMISSEDLENTKDFLEAIAAVPNPSINREELDNLMHTLAAVTTLHNPSNLEMINSEDLDKLERTLAVAEHIVSDIPSTTQEFEHNLIEELHRIVSGEVEPSHQEEEANLRNGQVEASHIEEAAVVPQTPPSDMNNLRNGQVETSHQEEAGMNDRIVPQAPPFDMDNLRNDGWIELADLDPRHDEEDTGIQARAGRQQMQNSPPQQGTAGRRMRLQVALCGAEAPSELKCVSIAASERTCMCGGMCLEQEVELLPTEPADLLCGDAICSSARVTMQEEGDTEGPLCAEGSVACVTKSDHPDVAQQTSQDASGSSSTSLVHLFLRLLGDACILPAFAAELSNEMDGSEDGCNCSVGCSEAQLEGRQSIVCHLNNTRPFLQQRMMPSSSIEKAEITKMQHELAPAVSSGECRKRCMGHGSGLALCLFWIATLVLIFLCLFRSFCRLTRTAFNYV